MTQTVLITGASRGFGRAFALEAIRRGFNVVAAARTLTQIDELAALAAGRVLALALDLDRPETFAGALGQVADRFGGLDILVNNAGFGMVGALEETPADQWQAIFRTNFFGAVELIRAALPSLRGSEGGRIVNVSSLGGQVTWAGFSAYSATKFALEGMSEALADELRTTAIRVTVLEPGEFRTDFATGALRHQPPLPAYAETVGPSREFARGMHGTQVGDPAKAAVALFDAIARAEPPFRLALGDDAVDSIRAHAEGVLKSLAANEPISRGTVYADATLRNAAATEGSARAASYA